ncbi:hypothetical protein AAVH_06255 [Aphelenchoides avenae]|nr:hypothetical protein AAVH_06255 [Aphelenchus avenae]
MSRYLKAVALVPFVLLLSQAYGQRYLRSVDALKDINIDVKAEDNSRHGHSGGEGAERLKRQTDPLNAINVGMNAVDNSRHGHGGGHGPSGASGHDGVEAGSPEVPETEAAERIKRQAPLLADINNVVIMAEKATMEDHPVQDQSCRPTPSLPDLPIQDQPTRFIRSLPDPLIQDHMESLTRMMTQATTDPLLRGTPTMQETPADSHRRSRRAKAVTDPRSRLSHNRSVVIDVKPLVLTTSTSMLMPSTTPTMEREPLRVVVMGPSEVMKSQRGRKLSGLSVKHLVLTTLT